VGVAPEDPQKVVAEMIASVTLNPIEAKLLIQMLTTTVKNFEEKYGAIVIPDDVRLPVPDERPLSS
jgi:hypothetical protein